MKAIRTKFIPATNTKPARISATAEGGHRIVISYDSEGTQEEAHAKAAIALCAKLGWTGKLVAGGLDDCYVFCFAKANHYQIDSLQSDAGFTPTAVKA
jgi:hypothetical protein